jgi:hypothetical protein
LLILIPVSFLHAVFFILAGRAWEVVALHFSVLLIVGLQPEPLEIGTARMGSSDPSSWPGVGMMMLSSACKEPGVDQTLIILEEMGKH